MFGTQTWQLVVINCVLLPKQWGQYSLYIRFITHNLQNHQGDWAAIRRFRWMLSCSLRESATDTLNWRLWFIRTNFG